MGRDYNQEISVLPWCDMLLWLHFLKHFFLLNQGTEHAPMAQTPILSYNNDAMSRFPQPAIYLPHSSLTPCGVSVMQPNYSPNFLREKNTSKRVIEMINNSNCSLRLKTD